MTKRPLTCLIADDHPAVVDAVARYLDDQKPPGAAIDAARRREVARAVRPHLERRGDPATLAFAWLLADERVSVVLGPRRPAQLEPALAALANPLTPRERDAVSDEFRLVPQS